MFFALGFCHNKKLQLLVEPQFHKNFYGINTISQKSRYRDLSYP